MDGDDGPSGLQGPKGVIGFPGDPGNQGAFKTFYLAVFNRTLNGERSPLPFVGFRSNTILVALCPVQVYIQLCKLCKLIHDLVSKIFVHKKHLLVPQ